MATEGKQGCVSCSIEALLESKTLLQEALTGRTAEDVRVRIQGALQAILHAERLHLRGQFPELAEKLRQFRKTFTVCLWVKDRPGECIPKDAIAKLDGLIDEVSKQVPLVSLADLRREQIGKHGLESIRDVPIERHVSALLDTLSNGTKLPKPSFEIVEDCKMEEKQCSGAYSNDTGTMYIKKGATVDTVVHEFGHYRNWVTGQATTGTPEDEQLAIDFTNQVLSGDENKYLSRLAPKLIIKERGKMSKFMKTAGPIMVSDVAAKVVEKLLPMVDPMIDPSAAGKPLHLRASPWINLIGGTAIAVVGAWYASGDWALPVVAFGGHMAAEFVDAVESAATGHVTGLGGYRTGYRVVQGPVRAPVIPLNVPMAFRGKVKDYVGRY